MSSHSGEIHDLCEHCWRIRNAAKARSAGALFRSRAAAPVGICCVCLQRDRVVRGILTREHCRRGAAHTGTPIQESEGGSTPSTPSSIGVGFDWGRTFDAPTGGEGGES